MNYNYRTPYFGPGNRGFFFGGPFLGGLLGGLAGGLAAGALFYPRPYFPPYPFYQPYPYNQPYYGYGGGYPY
ncbi:hypothetical protein [Bacillus methanolicus]|uniref:Putative membrane protein n=1 Tax=Bacillus methanolicus (strain MGA3 / ATCC 53907) TaxID=796606 RepID=I3DUL6_BACMM|nr:hypothetical protein [Bacillus methanolicus]AIE61183.1 putative membrane protein [Bacillus methanolicus MGA3]EIJ77937.1 hypothetical protein MGA3_16341 [Bacillus methanolicus MGA3]UQD53176.1 hypothetical protein C0971_14950 [Bacillus methanolicus]